MTISLSICFVFLRWSTCQKSCCFSLRAAADHFIVDIYFGVSFFKKRNPPATVVGGFGESRFVLIDGKEIIDSDIFWTAFHEAFDGEDSFLIILLLMKKLRYESLLLTESRQHGEEIIISNSSLFDIVAHQSLRLIIVMTK